MNRQQKNFIILLQAQANANRGPKAPVNPEEAAKKAKILAVNKEAAERRAEVAKFDKEIAKRRNLERRTGSRLTKNERIKQSNEQYLGEPLTGDKRHDNPLKKKAAEILT